MLNAMCAVVGGALRANVGRSRLGDNKACGLGMAMFAINVVLGFTVALPSNFASQGNAMQMALAVLAIAVASVPLWRRFTPINPSVVTHCLIAGQVYFFIPWLYFSNPSTLGLLFISLGLVAMIVFSWERPVSIVLAMTIPYGAYMAHIAGGGVVPTDATWYNFLVTHSLTVALTLAFAYVEAVDRISRMKATRSLMGIMAHELRTPLASMSLASSYFEGISSHLPVDMQKQFDSVCLNVSTVIRQMHSIIDLQIANAKSMGGRSKGERIDLVALVTTVVDEYPYKCRAHQTAVVLRLDQPTDVFASYQLVYQVCTNLLKNALTALEHNPREATPGDIEVAVSLSKGRMGTVEFKDRGCGMSPAQLERIFEPFYSTAPGASHGLGMTFVKQAVEIHHGHVDVWSTEGKGTTVRVSLPLVKGESKFAPLGGAEWK